MQALSKLRLIAERAKRQDTSKFTTLVHLINVELLTECYKRLRKDAARGVDGVTVAAYGQNLTVNLEDLVKRMKSKSYRPKPSRRVYIPKPGKKELRPLGIPSVEDKLVQMALKLILEAVFEPTFKDNSHGFRPRRGCHTAIKQLNTAVMKKNPTNYIVEVDIAKFFDTVNHYWLLRCIEERIQDPNLLWLIRQFLKAGIMDGGQWKASTTGTPQGGIVSPILANIYLHYVLDLWFEKIIKPQSKGYIQLIRYCDDFVVACESEQDANEFIPKLSERLAKFGLKISEEKTKTIEFGRQAWKNAKRSGNKVGTFNFLGFTHYCGANRNGGFSMRHKTSKQGIRRPLQACNKWLKGIRNLLPLKDWWPILKTKLDGHYGYFGVNGNMQQLHKYYQEVRRLVYKWINRRSQKKSMNWEMFKAYLQWNPLPTPRIMVQIW